MGIGTYLEVGIGTGSGDRNVPGSENKDKNMNVPGSGNALVTPFRPSKELVAELASKTSRTSSGLRVLGTLNA